MNPALKRHLVDVSSLKLDPDNLREHPQHEIDALLLALVQIGQQHAIVYDKQSRIVWAGNARLKAAIQLGWDKIAALPFAGTRDQAKAFAIGDNRIGEMSDWDYEGLTETVGELIGPEIGFDPLMLGFDEDALLALDLDGSDSGAGGNGSGSEGGGETGEPDVIPEPPKAPASRVGDLWLLGRHRLLCGDSTSSEDMARLVGRHSEIVFVHADPPYGMGKEADGVANDNLYREDLDAFQTKWWQTCRPHLAENASAVVWGQAEDLWRWWFTLTDEAKLTIRNEIVWDKGSGFGMNSELMHKYVVSTERALFFMLGQQMLGSQNKEDYWEGYEAIRAWMCEQRDLNEWSNSDINQITETQMAGHWFSQSQFHPISESRYDQLKAAAEAGDLPGFRVGYAEIGPLTGARDGGNEHRRGLTAELRERRTYFDNTHEIMRDVWKFERVAGEERKGHATPKPVAMIERAIVSSCPKEGVVLSPFAGSGTDLIAAHRTSRTCLTMELLPTWVDVCVQRWQDLTGEEARNEDGESFASVAAARQPEGAECATSS